MERGQQVHNVHQNCLDAAAAGGRKGDILTRTKEMLGNRNAVRAADTEPPEHFLHDHEKVAPTYITPPGPRNIRRDPCAAGFAGPHSWNEPVGPIVSQERLQGAYPTVGNR